MKFPTCCLESPCVLRSVQSVLCFISSTDFAHWTSFIPWSLDFFDIFGMGKSYFDQRIHSETCLVNFGESCSICHSCQLINPFSLLLNVPQILGPLGSISNFGKIVVGQLSTHYCLVVWLPWILFSRNIGLRLSSQLTHIFQRGGPTTNQSLIYIYIYIILYIIYIIYIYIINLHLKS